MPESDTVLVQRDGVIGTVVLNRPDKLNALIKPMWRHLGEVIVELAADDGLRCLVLRGAGEKSFSPGNDISEFETERSNRQQAIAYGEVMHDTLGALKTCRHPTVAMIKGICVGGGLEIACACDLRICGESSRFGAPIKNLGLVMAYPELRGLVDLAGPATAREILLEGRIFSACEAKEKAIVHRVVADHEVETEAYATAQRIAEGAPLVARWHKKFIDRAAQASPLTEAEIEESYTCYDTQDFQIGYRAFLNKTKPEFKGS